MGKTYDRFFDFISDRHQQTGEIPASQEVMDHFNIKTVSQDPDSIIEDIIYEFIDDVIRDIKKLRKL